MAVRILFQLIGPKTFKDFDFVMVKTLTFASLEKFEVNILQFSFYSFHYPQRAPIEKLKVFQIFSNIFFKIE